MFSLQFKRTYISGERMEGDHTNIECSLFCLYLSNILILIPFKSFDFNFVVFSGQVLINDIKISLL
jgi:hypothetical protein